MSNMPSEVPPEDVLNILIASDIHLGYAEKDSIRGIIFVEADVTSILCWDLINLNCLEYGRFYVRSCEIWGFLDLEIQVIQDVVWCNVPEEFNLHIPYYFSDITIDGVGFLSQFKVQYLTC